MLPRIQIYGQFTGHWSNAGVSRGLVAGLQAHGFETSIWDVDAASASKQPMLAEVMADGQILVAPHIARDTSIPAIFVGYPVLGLKWLVHHSIRIGAFICESSTLPNDWKYAAQQCNLLVVPSHWVANVFVRAGIPWHRITIVPHGLHPAFLADGSSDPVNTTLSSLGLDSLDINEPILFHVAGARDFLDRKGTWQLIEAFDAFCYDRIRYKPTLVIFSPANPALREQIDKAVYSSRIRLVEQKAPVGPVKMATLLRSLAQWPGGAALIQPSRAEAFGLLPCEARAAGLQVILTEDTGHNAHVCSSDIVIPTQDEDSITVNGIPGGTAPEVEPRDIVRALAGFLYHPRKYADRAWAQRKRRSDSWPQVVEPLAKRLKAEFFS